MSVGSSSRPSVRRFAAFRIVKRNFTAAAFSGLGARRFGGRWNSIGTSMVYAAGSLSLAVLEWRVHLAQWPPPVLSVIEIAFDEGLVWTPARLPSGWKQFPAPQSVAAFGDAWVRSGRGAVMRVPSAVVPEEWNYLLNPAHPDFGKINIGKPRLFRPDARLGPIRH
jgi:RES domain-containing protein